LAALPCLSTLVGPARTKLILLGGERLTADEALSFGLVERICEPEALLPAARSLCATALQGDPSNLRAIKSMIH